MSIINAAYTTSSADEIHDCKHCIDGDVSGKTELTFEVKLLNMEKLNFKFKLLELTIKFLDFYYCSEHGQGGLTDCPNHKYRVTVSVRDEMALSVSGAVVNKSYVTDENGNTSLFLPNGKSKITASKDGLIAASVDVEVQGGTANAVLMLMASN